MPFSKSAATLSPAAPTPAAVAETGVTRVILPKAKANNYIVGSYVSVGDIGSNTNKIVDYCNEYKIKVESSTYLNIAVEKMDKNLTINSIGILSPAAASLDQFKSYAHRGDEFKNLVNSLS